MPKTDKPHRVAVLIDLQNLQGTALSVLPHGRSPQPLQLDLGTLSRDVVAQRRCPSELHSVHVHTAVPTCGQSGPARSQAQRYLRKLRSDPLVHVHALDLATDHAGRWKQQGVDTAMSLTALDLAAAGAVDVLVVASADRDFEPVLRDIDRGPVHVEFARWVGTTGLWWHRKWVHWLDEHDLHRYLRWATPQQGAPGKDAQ